MSHMIEDNMMSFKGELPWHGLGVRVNPNATGQEMLTAAHMDWRVNRHSLAMKDRDGNMLTNQLAEYRAIVREDTNKVFQVAKDSYHVVQNSDIIDVFRNYCEAGHATMETVGALRGGAVVWALAQLNGDTKAVLPGNDILTGYMLLATSHDGTVRTIGKGTQTRVVCWNTLSAAMRDGHKAEFSAKHTKKWTAALAETARQQMGMAVEGIQHTNTIAAKLSTVAIDQSDWLVFMGKLLGENLYDTSDNAPGNLSRIAEDIRVATISSPGSTLASARGTLWGAVNGVSWFTDHERGRTNDTRMASAWFGDSERLKNIALKVAYEMATLGA